MKSNTFLFLPRLVLAICLLFLGMACGNSEAEKEQPKITYSMDLENSSGERISMEEFRGKVIFMNVWATWCAPCIEEMPTIHNLYRETRDREDLVFIMLSMDQEFEKAIAFRDKYGYDFEIYRLTGPMPAAYHTKLIPTTFVIDSKANLVLQHDGVGKFDSPEFKKFLSQVE